MANALHLLLLLALLGFAGVLALVAARDRP